MPKSEARSYDDFSYSVAEREKGSSGSLSPFTYLCTLLIFSLLGLIILYSSSYKQAIDSSLPHYFFFFRNLIAGISGLAAGIILRFVPLKVIKKGYFLLLPLSLAIFVLSFIPGLSSDGYLTIGGINIISPSLAAFITIPFVVAGLVKDDGSGVIPALISSFVLMLLSLFSGGYAWYLMMMLTLLISLRAKGIGFVRIGAVFLALVAVLVAAAVLLPGKILEPVFLFLSGKDSAIASAESAIVSGGIVGAGLGNGLYKLGVLENPQGILIFASYVEELGFLGVLFLLFLLLLIAIIGARTVSRAERRGDRSSAVIVIGFTLLIVLRSAVNILYVSGTLPLSGVLLPFFSYSPSDEFLSLMTATMLYRLIYIMGRENEKK